MAGKFLGKWTLFCWAASQPRGYFSYGPNRDIGNHGISPFYIHGDVNTPPREAHVAFILRDDGQLCFQLNNGQYVGYIDMVGAYVGFAMFPSLQDANSFRFDSRWDLRSLPKSFTSPIHASKALTTPYGPVDGDFSAWLDTDYP